MVQTIRRFGLLLLTYSLLRVGFHLWNWPAFAAATPGAVLGAYARGVWFDFSALATVNALWLALALALPPRWQVRRGVRGALLTLWLVVNTPFIGLNLMDYIYYGFINRRSTDELLTLTADVGRQAPVMVGRYWYVVVAIALLMWALGEAYGRLGRRYECETRTRPRTPRRAGWRIAGPRVLAVAVLFLGIRGSTGLKPLRVGDAFTQTPAVLGNLTLNSTFTFLKSIDDEPLERRAWFPTLAAARTALDPTGALARYEHPASRPASDTARPNVVVMLLESFASEYNGVENNDQGGYTPFFDSLAQAPGARLFPDHYANGHKSIEAVPSTLMGFPALTDEPLITSTYQANAASGLPDALRAAGYHTAFFHGAANGTMGFKTFTRRIGVEQYFGLNEYPGGAKSPAYDGTWGILDAPYLQYVGRQLSTMRSPFFATIFTLTSHEPYPVPEALKPRFPVGTLPIHQSVGYTDDALRQFFAYARRQPWYGRTLFVLLADHAQQSNRPGYHNVLGLSKTPLLLYRPSAVWPALNRPRVTQQADIPAT
ncbi:MAG: LTA synthase family protein, partial [Hymenobacteraceae bacterium]|nr:LTA synthase family protein [Hymenobacteraceae bacterium]